MAVEENNITKRIQKATSKIGTRLFRQNTGGAWAGKIDRGEGLTITLGPRDVVVRNAQFIRMGLITGSSDLIGWHTIVVTAAMIGRKIAVFTGFEVKTENGIPEPEQLNFVEQVQGAGGIAGIMRSDEDALRAIDEWENPLVLCDDTLK